MEDAVLSIEILQDHLHLLSFAKLFLTVTYS